MTIGERIAKCRKEKNLSQEYIAELLDVSRQAVSKWETNQTEPDTGNLIELARIFGVSVEYLANGEDAPPKVIYVERNIPVFKIIGIVLISLGGLSLILGALVPFMLGVGIVTVAFGLLLMLLKKDGLILSGIILVLAVILFVIQGIFFGIDTPIMCLIAAISVGLPILAYAIIKLVKKIKTEETIKKLKDNPTLIKRIIIVIVIAAIVATAIAVPASIASKRRKNAFEKAKFFSSERLSTFMVEGLPAPADIDCINLNSETILFYTDSDEFHEYLESVYNYLIGRNFKYLGTRGEVIYAEGEAKTYAFLPHDKHFHYGPDKHSGFNLSGNPDAYYFVFSNSIKNEETGEIECCVIHIERVEKSKAVIGGKTFVYNTIMSVYRESVSEGYKYPTYTIEYIENVFHVDLADYILPNQPTFSLPGKEVTVRLKPQSENFELWIDGGQQIQCTAVTDEYLEYTFTMPEHNIKLLLHPKGLH
ncbi:MAG: helix-turn-helix domain-containing protein [Clostridia bacterium]|nr:helix-turn-helix domain-containing protein [Clostridia bacterium]